MSNHHVKLPGAVNSAGVLHPSHEMYSVRDQIKDGAYANVKYDRWPFILWGGGVPFIPKL